jgi:hypothetical protein
MGPADEHEHGEGCSDCEQQAKSISATMQAVLDAATRTDSPAVTLAALRIATTAFSSTLTQLLNKEQSTRILEAALAVSPEEPPPKVLEDMMSLVATAVTRHGERTAALTDEERARYSACIEKAGGLFAGVMNETAGPAEACVVTHLMHVIARKMLVGQTDEDDPEQVLADVEIMEHRATPATLDVFVAASPPGPGGVTS